MSDVTTLYEIYDDSDTLLYVGISLSSISRLSRHKADKDWYYDIKRVEMTHYDTREEAERAERLMIKLRAPVYNVMHNSEPKFHKSRIIWLGKTQAAMQASISRVTLDKWIKNKTLPENCVLNLGQSGKVKINSSKLIDIVRSKRNKRSKTTSLDNIDTLEKVIDLVAKIRSL